MKKIILTTLLSLMIMLVSCSNNDNNIDDSNLNIITTTTMLYDLVNVIGGDVVNNEGLCKSGVDPHLYKATAGDITKISQADVIICNGLHLEGELNEVFSSLVTENKHIISAENGIDNDKILQTEDKVNDPHIWFSVTIWKEVATYVTEELSKIDAKNSYIYQQNLINYIKELDDLEIYIKNRINELEENQRVLITAHDAFNYFGDEYDFEVMAIQGINTQTQATTFAINELATYIAENEIKAIFIESSVPTKNIQALQEAVNSKGFSVLIGGELYSDSLGDENSNHETYIKTFKSNIDTIVNALK